MSSQTDVNDIAEDPLQRFLSLIGSPPPDHENWPGLVAAIEETKDTVAKLISNEETVADRQALEWLVAGLGDFLKAEHPRFPPPIAVRPAIVDGTIGEYPEFAALAQKPGDGCEQIARMMKGHFLICLAKRRGYIDQEDTNSYIVEAGRAVRMLSKKGVGSSVTVNRLVAASNTTELHKVISEFLESVPEGTEAAKSSLHKAVRYFKRILVYVVENQKAVSKKRRAHSVVSSLSELIDQEEGAAPESPPPKVRAKGLPESTKTQYKEEGSFPGFETPQDVVMEVDVSTSLPSGRKSKTTKKQRRTRAQNQAAALKTSLSPAASKRSTLHPPAMSALMDWKWKSGQNQKRSLGYATVVLMLLTGCRLEQISSVRIWRSDQGCKADGRMAIILDSEEIRIPAKMIREGRVPPEDKSHLYRTTQTSFKMRLPTFLPAVSSLLEYCKWKISQYRNTKRLPKAEAEAAERKAGKERTKAVGDLLSELSKSHGLYLYPVRVSKFLESAVYSLQGDHADAALLTHSSPEKNDSRLFYYAPTVEFLQNCHSAVWQRVAFQIGLITETFSLELPCGKPHQGPHVGSAIVPLPDEMISFNKSLAVGREGWEIGRRTLDWWVEYHNRVTAGLCLQIFWMTGIRPVRDVIDIRNYDPDTGFLAVDDKDNEDAGATRLVWLLPALQTQIERYQQHLETVCSLLGRERTEAVAFRFIGKRRLPRIFKFRDLPGYLELEYPYIDNAHRHYFRTRLRELGVDAGYVDAVMGHAGIGREPYGRFSALTPRAMQKAIEPAVNQLWQELEFRPVI